MEIKMIKEIMDYEESIFFGLSLRQCICSLLALGTSVALYFLAAERGVTSVRLLRLLDFCQFCSAGRNFFFPKGSV